MDFAVPPAVPLDVSVVLPVYNEAGHLADEIRRIRAGLDDSEFTYEIIVVDDGSTDGSGELLRAMEGIRLVQFAQNRGAGAARRVGTEVARAPVVVWTDADMTYPNHRIPELVRQLEGYDQVVGARTVEHGRERLLRTPAKWLIRQLAVILTQTSIPDLNSGFRAFRADVARQFLHLLPVGFSCVTTITLSFLSSGYSVRYVDIPYAPRAGRSKFHWYADTRRYILQIVRMVLMYHPLRVLGPPAVLLLLLGAGKLSYDLVSHPVRIASNTLVLLMAALLTLLTGLLSDLVVQLAKRPARVLPVFSSGQEPVGTVRATRWLAPEFSGVHDHPSWLTEFHEVPVHEPHVREPVREPVVREPAIREPVSEAVRRPTNGSLRDPVPDRMREPVREINGSMREPVAKRVRELGD